MAQAVEASDGGAKSLEEVLNSPGNVSVKFGLMSGLIKQGDVADKDIVDAVLNLVFCQPPYVLPSESSDNEMVGSQFDLEKNFIVQEAESVNEMMKLTETCPTKLQAEVLSVFTAMVRKSKRNCQACTEISLIEYILDRVQNADDVVADLLIDLLSVLASYSITVKELKLIFNDLKARDGKWPAHATKLLQVLRQMPQRHGPDEFFSFPGKRGSAIALPPIARWPYQNGWTFSTWMRLDPVSGSGLEREKPYLYTFKTAKGIGYSAHFLGNALVITVMKVKGKGFQHCVKYDFMPRKWYMVSIVHVYNRWSKSELRCFVDGVMVSQTEMSWLVSTNDPFDKCLIGSSVDNDQESMFCGQMSSIYLFSEALTQTQLQAAYTLGPGYKSQFRFDNESHTLISDVHQRVLYDSRLTQAIVFMYNPIACDSQLCLESSPKGNPSYFVHSPHALMLQDVKAVISHSIHSTLHSLGGIQVLFPLFGQIDCHQANSDAIDYSICATLMGLLCDLLESSTTIQQQFLQNKGFLVISHLLEKSSQGHITLAVLESFLKLTKYLVTLPSGTQLLKHLFDHILFNPALWIYTPVEVQRKLYSYLGSEFINDAQIYTKIRRVSAVLQTMHSLKYYYWVHNPKDRSGIAPKGHDGPRPSREEVSELRAYMLQYIKHLILKGHGIHDDELQSILNYLTTMHEDDNLLDVLEFTQTLMAQHPASMVPAFDRKHGVRAVYKLLASANEMIRISALKLLGYFLMRSTHKRKQESMSPHNLFSLLGERLMLNAVQLTMSTYNVLFEVLTERMSNKIMTGNHSEPDSSHKLENPMILKVIATLIRHSRQTPAVMEVKRVYLSDLTIMCNNNRENRRTVLQMSVWQDWLFGLAYIYPKTPEEQRITESVMALFKMLLHHAIKYEYGGWRVWIDTLAILHSKVSYEDFKLHMAQVYRQYEQQRVDDIADPDVRRDFPVSTISGVGTENGNHKHRSTVEITEVEESNPSKLDNAEKSDTESAESEKVESEQKSGDVVGEKTDELDVTPTLENEATESEGAEKSTDSAIDDASSDVKEVVDDVIDQAVAQAEGTERRESDVKSEPRSTTGSPTREGSPSVVGEPVSPSRPRSETEPPYPARRGSAEEEPYPALRRGSGDVRDVRTRPGDVRSDLRRTQSMHVNSSRPSSLPRQASMHRQGSARHIFSPGPRAPPFRIPEFKWSYLHQKLLSELLFSIETDVQVWKTHTTKTVIDFVNTAENHVFVVNVIHMISQLSDNLVTACGGLLPLLAAATSPNCELDMLEPSQGLSIEQAVSFLQRVMNLTDVLVFASSTNFGELEQEKNMSSGGILRQCLRLVATCAVRNCLECRHRQSLSKSATPLHQQATPLHQQATPTSQSASTPQRRSSDVIHALVSARRGADGKLPVPDVGGQSPVKDLEKLLQDMDVNRLRAVVYRDVEETKQAQFLALAIVYFVSVLMVSKYRDILEPPSPAETPSGTPARTSLTTPLNADTAEQDATEGTEEDEEEELEEEQPEPDTVLNSSGEDLAEPSPKHVQIAVDVHHGSDAGDGDNQSSHTATSNQDLDDSFHVTGDQGDVTDQTKDDVTETKDDVTETKDDASKETADDVTGATESDVSETKNDVTEEEETKNDTSEETKDDVTEVQDDVTEEGGESAEEKNESEAAEKTKEGDDVTKNDVTGDVVKDDVTSDDVKDDVTSEDVNDDVTSEGHVSLEGVTTEETGDESREQSEPTQVSTEDVKVQVAGVHNETTQSESKSQNEPSKPIVNGDHDPDKSSTATGGSESSSQQAAEDYQGDRIAAISLSDDPQNRPASLDLTARIPSPLANLPAGIPNTGSLTERLERALGSASPLLREIFVDFAPFLSKTLLGSHGQELLIGGLVTLKQSSSVVELVMLLCSQEWQNSLQKHAGLAFIELVNEGRLLAHATRDHIVRVANEAEFILNRMRADDVEKHAEFETCCAQTLCDRREEEKLCDHLITSARQRDHVIASKIRDKIVNIMTNKHGAWGSPNKKAKDFWKLDSWEDDSRRRRRLVKNSAGSTHPEATLKAAIEHGATEDAISQAREAFHAHLARMQGNQQVVEPQEEELAMNENELDQEFAGPVALSTPCMLLAPGVVVEGTMSVTKSEMYFEMDEESTENKKIDPMVMQYVEHLHGKWHFSEIRAIFARKYLLQNTAIEIFMANRSAVMFSFPDTAAVKKVINVLPRVGVGVKYGLQQARRTSMASPKQLFKLSNMTQKWQRREISNFDYLMYLNTVAGRSYNDLNQYPVFPWVLVNYDSSELDLTLPSNYRDLSKPVGALNPTRKAFFEERYATWEHDQIPPFHYGTHYSTAAFTLNWLIRVEPFTTFFLALQGGKFDHANRTFHSLSQSWKNCQRDTSDVKELIPEFYYLPEMFMNANSFSLGKQEDGTEVHDVQLPVWADSAEEFVRMNRMALESEFVSCQLHQWIDLIFGYKQKGPEAVRATNVFYYLTYEGSVNLENMNDPVMKEAIQNQIRSFGQTPSQLMTEPHPPRSSAMHMTPMMFSQQPDDVCMIMKFLSNSPVTYLAANTHPTVPQPSVTAITCNHNFSVNRWNSNLPQPGQQPSYAGQQDKAEGTAQLPLSMDQVLVMGTNLQRRNLGDNFDQRLSVTSSHFLTTSDNKIIMAAGFWDKSFRIFTTEAAKILQVVYGHFDIVTCIARSECNIAQDCYVVTGSKDCTVMVWLWSSKHASIIGENGLENPTPKVALTGHLQEVTCVAVSAELGLVFSGSIDGPVLVHTTQGDLLRSLEAPDSYKTPHFVTFAREGYILASYDHGNVATFTVNGKQLRTVKHNDKIQAITLSRDGQYMIMGGDNGVVDVWRTHDLSILYTYPTCDSSVRSLSLSHCQRYLLAGLATGCIIVFNIDFNKWHHEFQDKY